MIDPQRLNFRHVKMSYILSINEKLSNQRYVLTVYQNEVDWLDETLQNRVSVWQISIVIQYENFKLSETVPEKERESGESTLRSTEALISCQNNPSQEICCLPGARIQHIRERLPHMIKLEEYCPFLIFQAGSS